MDDALTRSGIEIGERVRIPDSLIPDDAKVEMEAKMAAGYPSAISCYSPTQATSLTMCIVCVFPVSAMPAQPRRCRLEKWSCWGWRAVSQTWPPRARALPPVLGTFR